MMEGRTIDYRPDGGGLDYHNSPLMAEIPVDNYSHIHRSIEHLRSIGVPPPLDPHRHIANLTDLRRYEHPDEIPEVKPSVLRLNEYKSGLQEIRIQNEQENENQRQMASQDDGPKGYSAPSTPLSENGGQGVTEEKIHGGQRRVHFNSGPIVDGRSRATLNFRKRVTIPGGNDAPRFNTLCAQIRHHYMRSRRTRRFRDRPGATRTINLTKIRALTADDATDERYSRERNAFGAIGIAVRVRSFDHATNSEWNTCFMYSHTLSMAKRACASPEYRWSTVPMDSRNFGESSVHCRPLGQYETGDLCVTLNDLKVHPRFGAHCRALIIPDVINKQVKRFGDNLKFIAGIEIVVRGPKSLQCKATSFVNIEGYAKLNFCKHTLCHGRYVLKFKARPRSARRAVCARPLGLRSIALKFSMLLIGARSNVCARF
ncbi:hypothetical protein EVAR_6413_1 [Eumeta japonica]|uniref:Uncharacterized protein n=1 Tax=Eumeta variegata TaxID=151549 RepID=A0A4C1TCP5_EUMVA|nr:hypothetical protein EVAR_6413_1 [Eumeta japonica]